MKNTIKAAPLAFIWMPLLFAGLALGAVPPSTGGSNVCSNGHDNCYEIVDDNNTPIGPASPLKPDAGWGSISGASWIGPGAGVSTGGNVNFRLQFTAGTGASLKMTILANPDFLILLDGTILLQGDMPQYVTSHTLDLGTLAKGHHAILFLVSDVGPTTGLNVSFTGTLGDASGGGTTGGGTTGGTFTLPDGTVIRTAHYSLASVQDPVDSATGEFYEQDADLKLGGPLSLGYARYYSSRLSSNGFTTSLGAGWMSNFDVALQISGTNAQALMFPPRILNFSNSGGSWQLVSPLDVGYQMAQTAGGGYQLMDPQSKLIYTFTQAGVLTSIADRKGNTLAVTAGANGPTQISDGQGRTLTLTYANNQISAVADQAGRTVRFAYANKLLSSATDPLGNVTKYAYTSAGTLTGLLTQKTLPSGRTPTTQTYDSSGRVISQTDANNNTFNVAYGGTGGTSVTDPLGATTKMSSDSNNALTSLTDGAGANASVTYDGSGRRSGISDKLGNKIAYTYHPQTGYIASITDARGNTTSYTYSPQTQGSFTFYNLTGTAYPDGSTSTNTYDANGNLTSMKLADGTARTYTYDANGRLTGSTDSNGQSFTYTYNLDSTMASAQDALGNKTTYTYDARKFVTKITGPNGTTSYVKDDLGSVTTINDPAGAVSTSTFDPDDRRTKWTSPVGGSFNYTYTGTGKVASITDPLGNTTTYTYDGADRQASVQNAAGETVTYAYDAGHRLASVTDGAGTRAFYTYDAEGRMTGQADGAGRKSTYSYDGLGNLTGIITPLGNRSTRTYDKRGRLTGVSNSLGETETFTRDAQGRLTGVTLPGGVTTTIKRDAAGNETSIVSPNGNTWTQSYDALGRRTKVTDPLGNAISTSFTGKYATGETFPLGTVALTIDSDGRITKRQYSDGTSINSTYDANGLMVSGDGVAITRDIKGQPKSINGMAVTFTPTGRPGTITYASGKTVTYAYDAAGRVSSITDWAGGKTAFTYDAASRLAGLTYPNGVATTYGYDLDGRSTRISMGSIGSISLTRDAAGKITVADRSLPTAPALSASAQQLSFDAAGQIAGSGTAYDKMGRVTQENGRTYTWNLATQLTGFVDGANNATLTYDALGEIATSTVSGTLQTFVFNYSLPYAALSIVRQKGADLRYYVYTPSGELLYSIEAGDSTRHFYHFDEMGNTVGLTGDNGTVTDTYAVTPYGDIADHSGTADNPFTWQGQYGAIQEARGLYFLRGRHYDASTARFVSREPFMTSDPRASEPYAYARGNPLKYVDPFGDLSFESLQNAGAGDIVAQLAQKVAGYDFNLFGVVPIHVDGTGSVNAAEINDIRQSLIDSGDCDQVCAAEGKKLADAVGQYAMSWTAFSALIPQKEPPPPPKPPVHVAPPPAVSQPLSGQSTSVQLNAIYTGAMATLVVNGSLVDPATLTSGAITGLVGNAGGTLVGNAGGTLVGNAGGTVISNDGGSVISNDGGSALANDGATIISDNSEGLLGDLGNE